MITGADHGKMRQTLLRIAYTGKPDFLVALDLMGLRDRANVQVKPVWSGGARSRCGTTSSWTTTSVAGQVGNTDALTRS